MQVKGTIQHDFICFTEKHNRLSGIILGNRYQPGYDPPIVAPAGQDI